jgi:spore germination protein YaaH
MDQPNKSMKLRTRLGALLVAGLTTIAVPMLAAQSRSAGKKASRVRHATAKALTSQERILSAKPLAMYYYISDSRGLESIRRHGSRMGLLAPQCYWITREGEVRGELPPHIAETARRARLSIMPLIFNRGFDREIVTAMLHNPAAQARAATEMAEIASRERFAGFQIDLENIAPEDQALFTEFVRQAADRLHEKELLLSVTLVPKFSDVYPAPSPSPSTGEWAAAYDFRALGGLADFLTLMTYDHFGRQTGAGPIAGYEWVRKALDFAVARISPEKILLGIPLYGREWIEEGDRTLSRSLTDQHVRELRIRWKPAAQWDERWQSPWFQFEHRKAVHTVWYEDRRSWSAKLGLISEYHLRGFAAWRLGFEGSTFWSLPGIRPSKSQRTASRRASSTKTSKSAAAKTESSAAAPAGPSH